MKKINPRIIPQLADKALENAKYDRKAAYIHYIKLYFGYTGRLSPGFNNADLQAYYDQRGGMKKDGIG